MKRILNIISFRGRATRIVFWIILMSCTIVSLTVLFLMAQRADKSIISQIAVIIFLSPIIWIFFAVTVRRCHDLGWNIFAAIAIALIPFIGVLILLYILGFTKGDDHLNRFDFVSNAKGPYNLEAKMIKDFSKEKGDQNFLVFGIAFPLIFILNWFIFRAPIIYYFGGIKECGSFFQEYHLLFDEKKLSNPFPTIGDEIKIVLETDGNDPYVEPKPITIDNQEVFWHDQIKIIKGSSNYYHSDGYILKRYKRNIFEKDELISSQNVAPSDGINIDKYPKLFIKIKENLLLEGKYVTLKATGLNSSGIMEFEIQKHHFKYLLYMIINLGCYLFPFLFLLLVVKFKNKL